MLRAKNQALVERLRQVKKIENRHTALKGKGARKGKSSRGVSFQDDDDDNDGGKKQRRKRIKKKKMGQTMMRVDSKPQL